jgi:exosome complex RNA-binding protein Csl4
MIPIRNMARPSKGESTKKARGFYRGVMKHHFSREVYSRRSLVETVNSMVKRKMGDVVYGKSETSRHKEVLFRCLAHNLRRLIDLKYSP